VELNAIDGLALVGDGGEFGVLGGTNSVEALGQAAELVTVRHPHGHGILQTLEELIDMATEASGLQISMAILTSGSSDNAVRVQAVGNFLQTVADSQNRDAEIEEGRVDMRSILLVYGVGATRQDDSLGLPSQIGQLLGAREHLGVDIDLAETAGDEVGTVRNVRVRIRCISVQLNLRQSIIKENILLRSIVEHQDGVEGVVGDCFGGRHCEDGVD